MYLRRLRDLREDHDLSQEQIAELLGIQQTVYSRYERGGADNPLTASCDACPILYRVNGLYARADG